MLAALLFGLSIGLLYVIVPAPVDLVAAQRSLRFGKGAGVAAQLGSMAADGLCAVLALSVLAPAATNAQLRGPISMVGLLVLVLVTATTIRALFRAKDQIRSDHTSVAAPSSPYVVHAIWGALATLACPFPLAYWTSLGATLSRFSAPERGMVGVGFLIVDVAWAIGFPHAVTLAPRCLPAALRLRARIVASLTTGGMACVFGAQLAHTLI